MFLILTAIAALISTIIWYIQTPHDKYKLGTLCLIYWGATLMWFIDHIIAFFIEGGPFFEFTLNATLLGFAAIFLGLIIWGIILLINKYQNFSKKLSTN